MNATQAVGAGLSQSAVGNLAIVGMTAEMAAAVGILGAVVGALAGKDVGSAAIGGAIGAVLGAAFGGFVAYEAKNASAG